MGMIDEFWTKTTNTVGTFVGANIAGRKSLDNGSSTDPYLNNRKYAVVITQSQHAEEACKPPLVIVGSVPESLLLDQTVDWKVPWGAGLSGNIGDLAAVATGNRLVAQVMTMQVWQGSSQDMSFTLTFELRAYSDTEKDVMIPLRNLMKMSVPSTDEMGFLRSPGPYLSPEGLKKIGGTLVKTAIELGSVVVDGGKQMLAAPNLPSVPSLASKEGIKRIPGSVGSGTWEVGNPLKGPSQSMSDGGKLSIATKTIDNAKTVIGNSGLLKKKVIEDSLKNKITLDIGDWFHLDNVLVANVAHTMKAQQPGVTGGLMSASVSIQFKTMFAVTAEDIDTMFKKASQK